MKKIKKEGIYSLEQPVSLPVSFASVVNNPGENFNAIIIGEPGEGMAAVKKEEIKEMELIVENAKRAESMNLLMFDRISLIMDLECVNQEFNLRLSDLLNADKFNFAHDICGIQNNLNRNTKQLENLFVPRFSR